MFRLLRRGDRYSPFHYHLTDSHFSCFQAHLNGVGDEQTVFLGISLVLMKGPFDALLEWPFKRLVTFSLLALDGSKQDRTEVLVVSHRILSSFLQWKCFLTIFCFTVWSFTIETFLFCMDCSNKPMPILLIIIMITHQVPDLKCLCTRHWRPATQTVLQYSLRINKDYMSVRGALPRKWKTRRKSRLSPHGIRQRERNLF